MHINYVISNRTDGANPFKIFAELETMDKESVAFHLKRMHYSLFLATAYWFAVATVAKSRAGMRCQICNCTNKIQVHHRTYDTHGYEHLNMMDLVVLCDNCHGLFHGHKEPEYAPPRLNTRGLKVKIPKNLTLPHSDSDIELPPGDPVILTPELIARCRANGSFTNATMRALGMKKPLVSGWVERLVGTTRARSDVVAALKGRFIYKSGPLERESA